MTEIGIPTPPFSMTGPLKRVTSDFGDFLAGDFTQVERDGMYQVTVAGERSVPFFIRQDVWRRTMPKAFNFYPVEALRRRRAERSSRLPPGRRAAAR